MLFDKGKGKSMSKRIGIWGAQQLTTEWVSCRSILGSLRSMYANHFNEFETVVLSKDHLVECDYVVFLDHAPPDRESLDVIMQKYKQIDHALWPELIFYIFNFTYHLVQWQRLFEVIQDFPHRFIVASEPQKKIFEILVQGSAECTKVIPFPVSTDTYHFVPELRKQSELHLVYAGRISYQKYVHELIDAIKFLNQHEQMQVRLDIAGSFDDISNPHFGEHFAPGSYEKLIRQMIASSEGIVKYVGDLQQEELAALYCQSDIFVSLSRHHDEDYGLACREALCSGLRLLLTDWGGHRDLKSFGGDVALIPLVPYEKGYELKRTRLVVSLINCLRSDGSIREDLAKRAANAFSSQAVAKKTKEFFLQVIDQAPIKTSAIGEELIAEMYEYPKTLYVDIKENKTIKSLYYKIYGAYAGN